jgi:hypothetical protein
MKKYFKDGQPFDIEQFYVGPDGYQYPVGYFYVQENRDAMGVTEVEDDTPPPKVVPLVVTMRQARLALLQQGLLANVDAAIETLPSPQKEAARIEWNYSSAVVRDRQLVKMIAVALGLNDEQLDDLFILAATL